jgi:hypothetical protein
MNDAVRSMKAVTNWRDICQRNKKGKFVDWNSVLFTKYMENTYIC